MCIGTPMQVIEAEGFSARCRSTDGEHTIDKTLVGTPPPGAWLMVFLGAAREVMTEEAAHHSIDALEALRRAMSGETVFDDLFADLVGREPELPAHLTIPTTPRVPSA
ncbi:MAG: HypC/HybG/HupF family hydrogenase formation chaperone [Hyphomicrobiaceae bacterium]|nr:HypC/HybG/HupF family hydrogenase formation chaperone [Hyphomicrobiaceae bacterium]